MYWLVYLLCLLVLSLVGGFDWGAGMGRLIDAEKLENDVLEQAVFPDDEIDSCSIVPYKKFEKILQSQPTAVVHCKDCENWDTDWTSERTKGLKTEYHYCPMVDSLRPADWFCGDGERKVQDGQ